MVKTTIEPDFKEWSDNIVVMSQTHGDAHFEIEHALRAAYNQGYSLGLNKGWAVEQDKIYEPPYERVEEWHK